MKIKKIATGGVLLALGLVLPQIFHAFGPQSGQILLPMHIPVLLAGLLLGYFYGAFIGILTPLLSFIITGMPPMPILIFMIFELAAYGLVAGLLSKKLNVYLSLIIAMVSGRVVYALVLIVAGNILGLDVPKVASVLTSVATALPGIAIQLIFIPVIVLALRRVKLDSFN